MLKINLQLFAENSDIESRSLVEIRQIDLEGKKVLEGYVAKFDVYTELYNGFYEKIDKHAFDESLVSVENIFLLYHHDYSKPLASTRNKTLELSVDDVGLKFRAEINEELTYAKDCYVLVKSGEMRGCSFGFRALKDEYTFDDENDKVYRTLQKVKLYEVTLTPIPAYDMTSVQARAKELREQPQQEKELAELRTELELFEIENSLL